MSVQANTDLLRRAYEAYGRGDIPGLLSLFTQDIEFVLPEVEGIPFTGTFHGIGEVTQWFRLLDECQEAREFQPDQFLAQDEQVVVFGHSTFMVRATGEEYSDQWCHLFRVEGGKIARFQEYSDTYRAALAFQPRSRSLDAGASTRPTGPAVH